MCHNKIVLKFKSIFIFYWGRQITYSEEYIIAHILSGDLLSLNENAIFWRFFIIFNILNVFVQ